MKKVLIIATEYAPIPSVEGGAVETLIDMYIDENELQYKNEITIYSAYSKKIPQGILEKYKKVDFRYIKTKTIKFKFFKIIHALINRINKNYIKTPYINKIIRDLKKNKEINNYDIVIVENIGKYTIVLNKYFKDKIVLHLHNDYLNSTTKLGNKILENCNSIWCVSQYICDRVKQINFEKSNKKVKLLYNGVDIKKFDKQKLEQRKRYRKEYGIDNDDFVFLYTGRIYKGKGVEELVKAYCSFLDNNDKLKSKLLIVGNSARGQKKYFDNLKIISKKYSSNIIFTGYIEYNDMPKIYNISDVQFVPSIENEAFGMIVVEGIASGIPVIISDSGGMTEIINNQKEMIVKTNNIIQDLINIMNKTYKNEKIIEDICKKQNENIQKFSKEEYCNNFQKLLDNFKQET